MIVFITTGYGKNIVGGSDVLHPHLLEHTEISYLYTQIDFSKFLPITDHYEWTRDTYLPNGFQNSLPNGEFDWYPNVFGSMKFVEEVIFPFLLKTQSSINQLKK